MPTDKPHPSLDVTPESGFHVLKAILTTREYLREHCELLAPAVGSAAEATRKAAAAFLRSAKGRRYLGLSRETQEEQALLESQLERAMYAKWSRQDGSADCGWRRIIEFQVPVKDRRKAPLGLKAIDLLGLDGCGYPVVIELKIVREKGGRNAADTPLLALLEAASYACILQADWPAFKAQLEAVRQSLGLGQLLPEEAKEFPLVIAGPPDYWEFWSYEARTSVIQAKPAFRSLVDAFRREGFPVSFTCVEGSLADPEQLVAKPARFLEG